MSGKIKILRENILVKQIILEKQDLFNERFNRQESVLDILKKNNVNVRFGCQGGSCGTCVCEVLNGIEFIDREGEGKQVYNNVKEKQILTCISTFKEEFLENKVVEIEPIFWKED